MPDVFLIMYERFNNTSPPNKLEEDVKCELAVQFNNIPYNLKGVIKTIRTTRRIDRMPNVFLIKYERFNNTNKLEEDVKCKLAVQFNNIPFNLKGVILHEGDSIENGKYCGIFSNILFDNTDNIFDMETIKKQPKELKKINSSSIYSICK